MKRADVWYRHYGLRIGSSSLTMSLLILRLAKSDFNFQILSVILSAFTLNRKYPTAGIVRKQLKVRGSA